jgi:hypothetical protein
MMAVAVELSELLADDLASSRELSEVVKATVDGLPCPRIAALIDVCNASQPFACYMTGPDVADGLLGGADSPEARDALVARARCLLGPPGRLRREAWVTPTAVALARDIYDSRHFALLGVLADALEEAGCRSSPVLEHCRGPGEHIRWCWVVDLIFGKG